MRFASSDFHALRYPLAALTVACLAGAALVFLTHQAVKAGEARQAKQEAVLREARERLYRSGEEKEKILRYRPAFAELERRGFVGEEQRINWVDALRAASLRLKMFGVSYQIDAQQPHGGLEGLDTGAYRLRQSLMKVSMGLLHEEDLMRFIDTMAEQQAGVFILRECGLKRKAVAKVETAGVMPHLEAECSLAWLSLAQEKKGETQ